MFDDLYFVDIVAVYFVLCFINCLWFFSPGFDFDFLSTSQKIGWKSISDMTYFIVSSWTLTQSINQSIDQSVVIMGAFFYCVRALRPI